MSTLRLRNRVGVNLILSILLLLTISATLLPTSNVLAFDDNGLGWKYSGKRLSDGRDENYLQIFADSANPDALYYGISRINGYFLRAVNWKNGTLVSFGNTAGDFPEQSFSIYAGLNGYTYASTQSWVDAKAVQGYKRFSLFNLSGTPIQHLPVYSGEDGSLITYALDKPDWGNATPNREQSHLWVSFDGGLNWQERGQNLRGAFVSLSASKANANSLYLLTRQSADTEGPYKLTLYYSPNAGATWENRYQFSSPVGNYEPGIRVLAGNAAPVDALILSEALDNAGIDNYLISVDGGRHFHSALSDCDVQCLRISRARNTPPQIWFGTNSFKRLCYNPTSQKFELSFSTDATSWNVLTALPEEVQSLKSIYIVAPPFAPSSLLLYADSSTTNNLSQAWYSADEGTSWQALPGTMSGFLFAPYQPLTLLGIRGGDLYSMELPDNGKSLLSRAAPSNAANSYYFVETGHNLSGAFKKYWDEHGGLAQFGFPHTEPFLELNQSDGKVYLTQYFERNRFEFHPANVGTPYEVELGLLGNQLTTGRGNEVAFKPIAPFTSNSNSLYFAETGHSLNFSFRFRSYWEQHGGLAIYGYPTSEAFSEVNPDDGKTYTVQYFERARFEYHPENQGTPYEVLLGLLGNSLLRQKSWL